MTEDAQGQEHVPYKVQVPIVSNQDLMEAIIFLVGNDMQGAANLLVVAAKLTGATISFPQPLDGVTEPAFSRLKKRRISEFESYADSTANPYPYGIGNQVSEYDRSP